MKQSVDELASSTNGEQKTDDSEIVPEVVSDKEGNLAQLRDSSDSLDQTNSGADSTNSHDENRVELEDISDSLDSIDSGADNTNSLQQGDSGQLLETMSVSEDTPTEQTSAEASEKEGQFTGSEGKEASNDSKAASGLDHEQVTDEQLTEESHDEL